MAMGMVMDPMGFVEKAAANGARYIKVLLFGTLFIGKRAALLLIEGRPDETITDTTKIKQIWIDGKPTL